MVRVSFSLYLSLQPSLQPFGEYELHEPRGKSPPASCKSLGAIANMIASEP